MNALCVVEIDDLNIITKESMDEARRKLANGMEYAQEKLLATLASKRPDAGDVIGLRLELDVHFAVKGKDVGTEQP